MAPATKRPVSAAEANAYAEGQLFRLSIERDMLKRLVASINVELTAVEGQIEEMQANREVARERLLTVEASARLLAHFDKTE